MWKKREEGKEKKVDMMIGIMRGVRGIGEITRGRGRRDRIRRIKIRRK